MNKIYKNQIKRIGKALFPVFSGIFFGYNLALIAGDVLGLLPIQESYWKEASICGALVGCLLVFLFSENFRTRKTILLIGVSISLISSFFGGFIFLINPHFDYMFNIIHFFVGITVGFSCVAPVFLVEEEYHRKQRGRYFSGYQLAITIGILIAYVVMSFLVFFGIQKYYHSVSLFVCTVLSIVYIITLICTESSNLERWAKEHEIFRKKKDEIYDSIKKKYINEGGENNKNFEKEIKEKLEEPSIIKKTPPYKVFRTPIIIGIIIIATQQIVGINVVIYKFPELLPLFGVDTVKGKLFFMIIIGLINVLSTIPGMLMIDRIGRRSLYLLGMCGIIISLSVLTFLIANVNPVYETIPENFHLGENSIKCDSIQSEEEYIKKDTLFLVDQELSSSENRYVRHRDFFEKRIALPNKYKTLYVETKKDSRASKNIYSIFRDELGDKKLEGKITFIFKLKNKELKLKGFSDDKIKNYEINDSKYYRPAPKFIFGEGSNYGLLFFISLVVVYVIFYASTLGILGWLVPAEIIPIKIRSQGMAIIAATHWFINFLIVALFNVNWATAFFVTFTILSIIAIAIGFQYFPETNSKKLKYIDYFWRGHGNINKFNNGKKFEKIAKEVEREVINYKANIDKQKKELDRIKQIPDDTQV